MPRGKERAPANQTPQISQSERKKFQSARIFLEKIDELMAEERFSEALDIIKAFSNQYQFEGDNFTSRQEKCEFGKQLQETKDFQTYERIITAIVNNENFFQSMCKAIPKTLTHRLLKITARELKALAQKGNLTNVITFLANKLAPNEAIDITATIHLIMSYAHIDSNATLGSCLQKNVNDHLSGYNVPQQLLFLLELTRRDAQLALQVVKENDDILDLHDQDPLNDAAKEALPSKLRELYALSPEVITTLAERQLDFAVFADVCIEEFTAGNIAQRFHANAETGASSEECFAVSEHPIIPIKLLFKTQLRMATELTKSSDVTTIFKKCPKTAKHLSQIYFPLYLLNYQPANSVRATNDDPVTRFNNFAWLEPKLTLQLLVKPETLFHTQNNIQAQLAYLAKLHAHETRLRDILAIDKNIGPQIVEALANLDFVCAMVRYTLSEKIKRTTIADDFIAFAKQAPAAANLLLTSPSALATVEKPEELSLMVARSFTTKNTIQKLHQVSVQLTDIIIALQLLCAIEAKLCIPAYAQIPLLERFTTYAINKTQEAMHIVQSPQSVRILQQELNDNTPEEKLAIIKKLANVNIAFAKLFIDETFLNDLYKMVENNSDIMRDIQKNLSQLAEYIAAQDTRFKDFMAPTIALPDEVDLTTSVVVRIPASDCADQAPAAQSGSDPDFMRRSLEGLAQFGGAGSNVEDDQWEQVPREDTREVGEIIVEPGNTSSSTSSWSAPFRKLYPFG